MTVKVQVGPAQIAIHQGQTVLISEEDGQINWPSEKGLYFFDTRIVSSWRIYANGEPWELLNGGATSYYASRIYPTNRSFLTEDGPVPPRTLGLTLSRSIGGGMHEDLDVINPTACPGLVYVFTPQAKRAVQGVPEASHCGIVTSEHLRRDHPLHLVPRRDAGQPGDDDGAHLVPLLLVANVWAYRGKGLRADVVIPSIRSRSADVL
jgi:hypothetical protein